MDELAQAIAQVRERIPDLRGRRIGEQNTKATLIDPILRALGWNVEDFDEVYREFKRRPGDKPVDYALMLLRTPKMFVEAKALDESVSDRRWANQIMGYAAVAGVEWKILTNGDEYRLYNAAAPVPVEAKLFRTVSVTEEPEEAARTLTLLSKDRMQDNSLRVLWEAHFIDRQLHDAVHEIFSEPDRAFVSLVRKRTSLSLRDVREGLARVRVQLDFPKVELDRLGTTARATVAPQTPTSADLQAALLRLLAGGPCSIGELARQTSAAEHQVRFQLNHLRKNDTVALEGHGKAAHWQLTGRGVAAAGGNRIAGHPEAAGRRPRMPVPDTPALRETLLAAIGPDGARISELADAGRITTSQARVVLTRLHKTGAVDSTGHGWGARWVKRSADTHPSAPESAQIA